MPFMAFIAFIGGAGAAAFLFSFIAFMPFNAGAGAAAFIAFLEGMMMNGKGGDLRNVISQHGPRCLRTKYYTHRDTCGSMCYATLFQPIAGICCLTNCKGYRMCIYPTSKPTSDFQPHFPKRWYCATPQSAGLRSACNYQTEEVSDA